LHHWRNEVLLTHVKETAPIKVQAARDGGAQIACRAE
jgi:hypothetical protein